MYLKRPDKKTQMFERLSKKDGSAHDVTLRS